MPLSREIETQPGSNAHECGPDHDNTELRSLDFIHLTAGSPRRFLARITGIRALTLSLSQDNFWRNNRKRTVSPSCLLSGRWSFLRRLFAHCTSHLCSGLASMPTLWLQGRLGKCFSWLDLCSLHWALGTQYRWLFASGQAPSDSCALESDGTLELIVYSAVQEKVGIYN